VSKAFLTGLVIVGVLLGGNAAAQGPPGLEAVVSGDRPLAAITLALSSDGDRPRVDGSVDYTRFGHELVAWVLKEALPDSDDGRLPAAWKGPRLGPAVWSGSRLGPAAVDHGSEFGSHCLAVLSELHGRILPPASGPELPSLAPGALVGMAFVAIGEVWSPLRKHVEGRRSGFSLEPKVGSRRLGLHFTYHW
jgi:hypothetical protein